MARDRRARSADGSARRLRRRRAGAAVAALAEASAAIARLDQALASHPLRQAFLYRARLEAVRRQAAVDGALIDPWHLAATLEGLRLRMDPFSASSIAARSSMPPAPRSAASVARGAGFRSGGRGPARRGACSPPSPAPAPLLGGGPGLPGMDGGGEGGRRSARPWSASGRAATFFGLPVPLTGAAALRAEQSWEPRELVPAFLRALEREAAEGLDLLLTMERTWFEARRAVGGRRKTSYAGAAVDVLAAAPVISATSLARILGIAVKNAIRLLDELARRRSRSR